MLALVVLVVNDHMLKAAWPGFVTGKLSDVAGLILFPALLDLVIRRPGVSIAITGVGFTLVKTTAAGAWLASEAWTAVWGPSKVLADPTDLLALPALWVAWWACRHPVPVHKAVVYLVVPPAVLAVAATSAAAYDWPYEARNVESAGDEIVVHTSGGYGHGDDTIAYRTRDGVTWHKWISLEQPKPVTRACLPDVCYRITPGRLRVDEGRDGRWTTVWQVPDEVRDRLARSHPEIPYSNGEPVGAVSVAVTERLVVAANGTDGIALRDAGGAWHRLGLGPDGFDAALAAPLTTPGRYDVLDHVAVAALAAALLAVFTGTRHPLVLIGGALMVAGVRFGLSTAEDWGLLGLANGVLLWLPGGGLVAWGVALAAPPARLAAVTVVSGLLGGLAVLAPFAGWSHGWPDFYAQASDLARVTFMVMAIAGAVAGFVTSRPR